MSSAVEPWVWLGLVVTTVTLRFVSRTIHLGSMKKLQMEDALMGFVGVFYICLTVFLDQVNYYGTNEIPPSQFDEIDPASIPSLIHGSKLVIVVEQFWLATIWGCKACLLMLYSTMTLGLWQHVAVKGIAVFCALSYAAIEICFFAVWCRPFYNYWSVPPANFQCAVYHDHLILVLTLNTLTDLLMMGIPLPILIRARLSPLKKTILCCVFSLGGFVIICSIMSKYYSLSQPYGSQWVAWYVREAGTAVIVANIPQTWTLVRRLFNLRSFLPGSERTRKTGARSDYHHGSNSLPLSYRVHVGHSQADDDVALPDHVSGTGSQDQISNSKLMQIWEQKDVHVTTEVMDSGGSAAHSSSRHSSTDSIVLFPGPKSVSTRI